MQAGKSFPILKSCNAFYRKNSSRTKTTRKSPYSVIELGYINDNYDKNSSGTWYKSSRRVTYSKPARVPTKIKTNFFLWCTYCTVKTENPSWENRNLQSLQFHLVTWKRWNGTLKIDEKNTRVFDIPNAK